MAGGFELVRRVGTIGEWRHPDNGVTALVAPTPVAPVAGLGVVYQVGSRFEGTGHTGATHILGGKPGAARLRDVPLDLFEAHEAELDEVVVVMENNPEISVTVGVEATGGVRAKSGGNPESPS